jgi:hypothetical protein
MLLLAAGVFLGTACEDRSFFLDDQRGNDPTLINVSVREGEILPSDAQLELEMADDVEERSGAVPQTLRIEILDGAGESLGVQEISGAELNGPLPSITLDQSSEGLHTILLRLTSESGTVITEKRIRFFSGTSYPSIDLLETYPPEAIPPGGKGIIVPKISDARQGWLRWSSGGEVLASGRYEEFRGGFVWSAPRETGVYTIRLELFPVPPPELLGGSYPFTSPVTSEVQFFVSASAPSPQRDLGPAERYRHLLHLGGNVQDSGYAPAEFAFDSVVPQVVIREGLFGYRFTPGTSLAADTPFLPASRNGIAPFTLTFRYLPEGDQQGSRLVHVSDRGGGTFFLLAFDENGIPYLNLEGLASRASAPPEFLAENCREIACSLIPREGQLEVRWYRNGRHLSSELYSYQGSSPPEEGRTVIGGSRGFRGVLHELGLYTRGEDGSSSADTQIFRRYAEQRYGKQNVVFADGFEDRVYLLETDEQQRLLTDVLQIPAGEERQIITLQEQWRRLEVEVELLRRPPDEGYVALQWSDGHKAFIAADGSLTLADPDGGEQRGERNVMLERDDSRLTFTLTAGEQGLVLPGADGAPLELPTKGELPYGISVGLRSGSGEQQNAVLRVEHVLVVRAAEKLAEKEKNRQKKIES